MYLVFLIILLTGCANKSAESDVYDPIEPVNRAIWDVNYGYIDPYLYRPASVAYTEYVPSPARTGMSNFLSNLEEPTSVVSRLIMLQPDQAITHFSRFFINTTLGLGGLLDIATLLDIRIEQRDFSDAMGYYGVGNGAYVMLPLYGPLSVREGVGDTINGFISPMTFWQSVAKWGFEGLDSRAKLIPQEPMIESSTDSYIFIRDSYIQNQNYKASDGELDISDDVEDEMSLEDYFDEIDN
ncbi:MlaA family lipoprotein [Vibrio sp. SS-MA-C1-2]|uniref:MlaA family lipoprotein n=1 Tax=Vibrio sp. SS-MA-C1-2 TaxID=2908646 RepID=UPI001F45BF9F|nr:MlaA family lipoprotein [Vibrio sp. SS-MA-C1-2]UJF20174.1 MlaA family lipoprotein [Vibrio sp. SS-MA-C1-2]